MPRRRRKGKRTLLCAAAFFVLVQLGLNVAIDWHRPDLYDLEYHIRLSLLKRQLDERGRPPLLLAVGSSRTVMAFRPEVLPPLETSTGRQVLAFNFSHLGAGPVMNLMELRRLLDQGIRPDWLVIEVMPPFLAVERIAQTTAAASARDLPFLGRYYPTIRTAGIYARSRLAPCYEHRLSLVRELAPRLSTGDNGRAAELALEAQGSWWVPARPPVVPPEEVQRATAQMQADYFQRLQDLHMLDGPVQALRDLLELCRRERIGAVLILMPESSQFRGWYSAASLTRVQQLADGLSAAYSVPLIDARTWVADDDFSDGHHTLKRGANLFTLRLGAEVLQPLVAGKSEFDHVAAAP